jgi:hypothetical protein
MTLLKLLQTSSTRWKQNMTCKIIFYSNHVSWQRFSSRSWHAMTEFCLCSLVGRWRKNSGAIYHMFWSHITILWHDQKRIPVSSFKTQRTDTLVSLTSSLINYAISSILLKDGHCDLALSADVTLLPYLENWTNIWVLLILSILKPVLKSLRFL